jgi:multidrug efflux pump subunit AcrA (membrane-fusion protein)
MCEKERGLTDVKKKNCMPLFLLAALLTNGCSVIPEQVAKHPDVVVEAVEEADYNLAQVERGDIKLTKKLYFLYSQTTEEGLSFATENRRVVGVYVDVGDEVTVGQLIAELYTEDLEENLASYEYQKERYELLNSQAEERFAYDKNVLKSSYDSETITKAEYKNQLDALEEELDRTKEGNNDALTILKLRMEEIQEQMDGCKIYAGIDGVVTYLLPRLLGSSSDEDVTVCRLINSDECLFRLEDSDYSSYFETGQSVYLKVSDDVGYETTVARIEKKDEEDEDSASIVYLEPDEIDTELAVGTRCYYELLLDEREDVLYLPNRCVFVADDQAYVFVEDDGGMMSIQYITIGMQGDSYTEITGGLEEGDIVIRK